MFQQHVKYVANVDLRLPQALMVDQSFAYKLLLVVFLQVVAAS